MAKVSSFDVIIIGGGPAGLTAALYLSRSRRRTLVLDAGQPRNAAASNAHGVFSREGADPAQLLTEAREQFTAYPGAQFIPGRAETIEKIASGFIVRARDGGAHEGRRLLFATGIRDDLPAVPGLAERWAHGVYHCVYCHGFEAADLPLALIAPADAAQGAVPSVFQISRQLALCTNGEPAPESLKAQCAAHGVAVIETRIDRVSGEAPDLTLHFADGARLRRGAIFVRTILSMASELPAQIGCELETPHKLIVGANWQTSVAGVYAAGDIAAAKDQVIVAAASGAQAAIAINTDLVQSDW